MTIGVDQLAALLAECSNDVQRLAVLLRECRRTTTTSPSGVWWLDDARWLMARGVRAVSPTDPDLRAALLREAMELLGPEETLVRLSQGGDSIWAARNVETRTLAAKTLAWYDRARAALQDSRPEKVGCPECGGLAAHWGTCSKAPTPEQLSGPHWPRCEEPS